MLEIILHQPEMCGNTVFYIHIDGIGLLTLVLNLASGVCLKQFLVYTHSVAMERDGIPKIVLGA